MSGNTKLLSGKVYQRIPHRVDTRCATEVKVSVEFIAHGVRACRQAQVHPTKLLGEVGQVLKRVGGLHQHMGQR